MKSHVAAIIRDARLETAPCGLQAEGIEADAGGQIQEQVADENVGLSVGVAGHEVAGVAFKDDKTTV